MTRTEIGRFTSEAGRKRFLTAYEAAMGLWPRPRSEADVETSLGTVHVHRYGAEGGDPVVLLHGHAANASAWSPQVEALGAVRPVIAVDTLDDPGRSVQRGVADGSAGNALWLGEVLAGLGLERVHLIGHSHGGWLALNQAVHGAERLASVTVLDPGGLQKVPRRFYVNMAAGLPAMLAPRRARPVLARWLANSALVAPPELLKPGYVAARAFRPAARPPARVFTDAELGSIRVPVLALLAERSVLLDAGPAGTRIRSLVPDVRAETVDGAGHGLHWEQPDLVNERILRFLAPR